MTAAEIVKALSGRGNSAPCPVLDHGKGRGDRRHSLSVHDGIDGKVLAKCHGGCPQADVWAALKAKGLVGNRATSSRRTSQCREDSSTVTDQSERSNRLAEALAFREASRPAFGTPAEEHLRCRGIIIEPPGCIRYHAGKNALVALVQAPDGTFSGIQRIYLTTDCRGTWKQGRFSLGLVKGGAVRLTPTAESLQLCESVEDGLALLQMTGKPTWAVPGAGFMESFEPPEGVKQVVLAPDHDKAGIKIIPKAASRLIRFGCKVEVMLPPIAGSDWSDIIEIRDERAAIIAEGAGLTRQRADWLAVEHLGDG